MEIGSFIRLDLKDTGEYYKEGTNIARLNIGRAGIFHACRLYNCKSVYLPYYLCPTVKRFLFKNDMKVKFYSINDKFEPSDLMQEPDHAVLLVNYFGILSGTKMKKIANRFSNIILDNSAGFYSHPISGCFNVYSHRKFFGVPDGSYVIGDNAELYTSEYSQDYSSDTSSFLLKRIEYGLNLTYAERMKNEERIDNSGILRMSNLTNLLLKNIDYLYIKTKRQKNFHFAHSLFKEINRIEPTTDMDNECVPMVYPLVIENVDLNERLKEKKIFTGRWWNHVLFEVSDISFEAWLSKYMIPVPIDQRYGEQEILYVFNVIIDILSHGCQNRL